MSIKIAIQGFKASFHEIAAFKYFGKDIETIECETFQALFDSMEEDGAADYAVMAIENSVAGSILPNYARLRDADLEIFGEVYLRIEMNLMALHGETIDTLSEVHSHPMALLQCQHFFRQFPHIKLIESKDTALSAIEIVDQQLKGRGAIGSKLIAETFDLNLIAEGIETNKRNFTRFLILKRKGDLAPFELAEPDKASLSFRALHRPGSLSAALSAMAMFGMNLTKIQSLPVLGEEWQYFMYADLEFKDYSSYLEMLEVLQPLTKDLKILGEYKQGQKI
ncbi:MAG: prephenate dehydratase [Chitinophagales bacterium]|nr:prephenate dehydratase [Chitinophagales bacterium]MCZ2393106.1 prephenate dehydratase [Chitinophagales bacterium]